MSSLKSKFLYQLSVSLVYAIAPLITFPYIARVLGPSNLGIINFVDYTAQIFMIVAAFGIPLYGVREISRNRDNKDALQKIASELLSIHLLITLISIVFFTVTLYSVSEVEVGNELLILAALNIAFGALSFDWLIHGLEDFKFLSIRATIARVALIIAILLFVQQPEDYLLYFFILVLTSISIIIMDLVYVSKLNLKLSLSFNFKKHIKPLFVFFLTSAGVSLYTYLDTFILGVVTGSLAVGFYTTALKIVKLSQNFINDLGGVLMPRVSLLVEKNDKEEMMRLLNKSLYYVLTVSIPLSIFFFLMAPEIVRIIAGLDYLPAITTLQILSVLPLVVGLSNIYGIQILVPFGKEKQMLLAIITGSIVSIILALVLCPILKEDGAAVACIMAEIAVTLFMGYYAGKIIKVTISQNQVLSIFFCSLLFIPSILLVRYLINIDWVVLILSIAVCGILYFSLQIFTFSNSILKDMVQFARLTFNKLFQSESIK